jgi:hypothetical protein
MTMHEDDDRRLDDLLSEARARPERPPGALLARVLADAEAAAPRTRGTLAGAVLRALGGWPAAAGLAAACATGIVLGYTAPGAVPLMATDYELIDLAPAWPVLAELGG